MKSIKCGVCSCLRYRLSAFTTHWLSNTVAVRVLWATIAHSVYRLAVGCTVRGSNRSGGKILCTFPDRPWGPPSLLQNGYQVSFPGVKRPGRCADHLSRSCVKERVELYLYSPSGSSSPVLERNVPLPFYGSSYFRAGLYAVSNL